MSIVKFVIRFGRQNEIKTKWLLNEIEADGILIIIVSLYAYICQSVNIFVVFSKTRSRSNQQSYTCLVHFNVSRVQIYMHIILC